MNDFPSKNEIKRLKEKYPVGSIVKLIKMDDPHVPKIGTLGKVKGVDDIGNLLVDWNDGSCLNVVYLVDKVVKL